MDKNCVFCRVISGEFPSEKVYEDDIILAIKDISPVAPHHILILPKKHSDDFMHTSTAEIADIFAKVPLIAEKLGIKDKGFRLVINTGDDGGQTVDHMHVHLLGGRAMNWPPG